jgi:methyltransferase (TIGR00027 family)
MRAAHRLLDHPPLIFDDPLAMGLSGMANESATAAAVNALKGTLAGIDSPDVAEARLRTGRLCTVTRARYTEDELRQATQRGISQYVILGAGYDSFAYCRRQPPFAPRVFEIDHPDTQRAKQARLRELSVDIPADVTFVAVDFEQQSISEALRGSGYQIGEPAFFSWLGVTWYLSNEAIEKTLGDIAGVAADGSEIVLDYFLPESMMAPTERRAMKINERLAGTLGERGGNCFTPERIKNTLELAGFSDVVNFGSEEANSRYYVNRSDGLLYPKAVEFAKARIRREE